jgi:hypothetical protein
MCWLQVLEELKQGKKFKRRGWTTVIVKKASYNNNIFKSNRFKEVPFTIDDFQADDWEEVRGLD